MSTRQPDRISMPRIIRGATWIGNPIALFEDEAHEHATNLTGDTVWVQIEHLELKPGKGLTVALNPGVVTPELSASQTSSLRASPELSLWVAKPRTGQEPLVIVAALTSLVVGGP